MKRISAFSGIGLSRFLQSPTNVLLIRIFPIRIIRVYLYILGSFYLAFQGNDCIRIISSLKFVLHKSFSFVHFHKNVVQTLAGLLEHYLEKLLMAHRNFAKMHIWLGKRLTIHNRDILDQTVANGKGGILVTGHFGAVEFLPLALSLSGYKIAMIVKFKTEALRKASMKKAAEVDVILIDAGQDRVLYKALDAIKKGRFLITECDEFSQWIRHKEKKVALFGNKVFQDKALDFLYRRAKVPAMLGLMKRDSKGYVLSVDALADGSEKVSLGNKAWKCLEKYILETPYQWYQWKNAAIELAPFIEHGKLNENNQSQNLPAVDTVFAGN